MLLADRVALVTGGGRGIGRAISLALAAEGARVAVCDVDEEPACGVAREIGEAGGEALAVKVDVTDPDSVAAAVDKVLDSFGRVDILVNNAGVTRDRLLVRMDVEDWEVVLGVNLRGTFLFTKAVARSMMKQRCGAIVNVASVIGIIGNAGQGNYAASKAGVIGLTKTAAREFAGRGIRVNAVAPGFIETRMTDALSEDVKGKMLEVIPSGRFGTPQDVSDVVVFLASDMARYVTGQVVNVDGGMVM